MTGGPTIIMYHSISAADDPYTIRPSTFRQQLELIASEYQIIRLRDIRAHLSRRKAREVVITFDDAFGDFAESAIPVLADLAIPSTLFVPTGCIGGSNTWDRGLAGMTPKRIMTEREIRAVCATGLVDLGSHTVDHARMSALPREQMETQASRSKRMLEDVVGKAIDMFSYPYGQRDDFSPLTSEILAESGYSVAVTTCWGTRNAADELLTLRRIWLAERDSPSVIRKKIDGYYNWIGVKESLGYAWRSRLKMSRPQRSNYAAAT